MEIKLYPDETIYSICSRIHASSGEKSIIKTLDRLFKKKSDTTNRMWKTGLSQLAEYIGVDIKILLDKHSVYPYFEKFCTNDIKQRLKNVLSYGKGNPSKIIGIYHRYSNPPLLLCPVCAEEDFKKYGEPYWHRSHQLPGSLVCSKHNIRLIKECSTCNEPFISNKIHEFIAAPLFCSNGHLLSEKTQKNESAILLTLAIENDFILNTDIRFSIDYVREKIQKFARLQGYISVNTSAFQYNKLYSEVLKEFPLVILNEIDNKITETEDNWLRRVFWNDKVCTRFPPHYVIVMVFFSNSINSFLQANADFLPFDRGPWQCKNIICSKYNMNIITEITFTKPNSFIVGTFKCPSCEFTYTRHTRLNVFDEESMKVQTIKETGPLWDAKLEELLQDKNIIYIKTIAKQLNVSSRFLLTRLKNRFDHLEDFVKCRQTDTKRIHRKKITGIIAENHGITRTEVRKKASPAFQWLLKYDNDWLVKVVPIDKYRITIEQRREKMLTIIASNPGLSRKELKKIDVTTYEWLIRYDYDWIKSVLPAIRSTRVYQRNYRLEDRREVYLQLRIKYPDFSRTEIFNLDPNNYHWLKSNDSDWLDQHQPPYKSLKGWPKQVKLSIEERRDAFISIFESNPKASRKDLKRLCGNNYIYLERRDKEWFRAYLPLMRGSVNNKGRKMSKEQRRELFLVLRNHNPYLTRTQLQILNNANYSWLKKNDKSWLYENAPPIRTRSKIKY